MGYYIVLVKLTDSERAADLTSIMDGIATVWKAATDAQPTVHAVEGPYDLVVQGETKDPMDIAWLGTQLAGFGISTCSMQAYTRDEMAQLLTQRPLERGYPVSRHDS